MEREYPAVVVSSNETPKWAVAVVIALITLVVVLGVVAVLYAASASGSRCARSGDSIYSDQLADVAASSSKAAAGATSAAPAAPAASADADKATPDTDYSSGTLQLPQRQDTGAELWMEPLPSSGQSPALADSGAPFAPHSATVPPAQRATVGVDQPSMKNHPLEVQARAVFADVQQGAVGTECYEPRDAAYNPSAGLLSEAPSMVPVYQERLKSLPAMHRLNLQQESSATNIGPTVRQGIDTHSQRVLDREVYDDAEGGLADRVSQTAGATTGVAGIYGRGDTKGISMINRQSTMVDPTKMLPSAKPGQESARMVQAGPSIEQIAARVPKAADIMRMMRSGSSVLSSTIPRDRPPVYTEGLNAFRQTRLPAQTAQGTLALGLTPYEVSDIVDYSRNPFLYNSRAAITVPSYQVPA